MPERDVLPDLFIRPDYDNALAVVTFTAPRGCTAARCEVLDGDRVVSQGRLETAPGAQARIELPMGEFKPWSIESPHLYTLQVSLDLEDGPRETREEFGMRKIHADANDVYLNNRRIHLRGYVRGREAHDHPNLLNLPLEEYYAKNIRAAKAYGFNLIRFHSQIPPEECFRVADRLGMFIHVEMRKYYGKYQKERSLMLDEGTLLDDDQWREMVLRLRNHPSLLVYCMGNEIDHPGKNPRVAQIYRMTKELDPTRLVLDTCSRGEFDRENVDIDVQHMGYFYPFGRNYGMFEDNRNWLIYGSCRGLPTIEQDPDDPDAPRVTRSIELRRPMLGHEICHYIALRDLDALDRKFEQVGAEKPWWIAELKKLIRQKNLEKDYPLMLEASRRFQFLSWKLGIEAARRSPLLRGFHFLQLSDTERYENCNGILDCFDDPKGTPPEEFVRFNGPSVVLADLPRRTYFEGEKVTVPFVVSHYSDRISGLADFSFDLADRADGEVLVRGGLAKVDLTEPGRREICRAEFRMPSTDRPRALRLCCRLAAEQGSIQNEWNLWLYPNRPERVPALTCTCALDEVNIRSRYPQIQSTGTLENPEKLLIVNRFSAPVIRHLAAGGDVLLLYRIPETRDRKRPAPKEEYYLPTTWDRFKGVIWDRGTNCGAFMRQSALWEGFPHDGFMDLQFYHLVDDCDKMVLDDFPCQVEPIMQGVDKAVRDRFDVFTYGLSEFQPGWTMRKFAYIFELKVGKGRLFATGLNFTGLRKDVPETCALFEAILRYVASDAFQPSASIEPAALERYLLEKGKAPRIKERRMTQFWQLDEEPLESRKYWKESIEYLGEKPVQPDLFLEREGMSEEDRE